MNENELTLQIDVDDLQEELKKIISCCSSYKD